MPQRTLYADLLEKDTDEEWTGAIILSRWLDQFGTDLDIASVGSYSILSGPDEDLTLSDLDVNATSYTSRKKGTAHPAGEVIFYTVAGGTRQRRYDVKIPFTTSDGQTLVVIQPIYVI
jgi:hypothetical protein